MQRVSILSAVSWLAYAIIGIVAFRYGYDFGTEVSGKFLGVVAGLNTGVFAMVLAGTFLERVSPQNPSELRGE